MLLKKIKLKSNPKVLGLLFLFVVANTTLYSQQKKLKNKVLYSVGASMDYDHTRPGFANDLTIEHNVYRRFSLAINYHRTRAQHFVTGRNPYHNLFSLQDTYAEYFRGKSVDYFFGRKGTSYIKNAYLFDFNLNYRLGKKNYWLPEFGISLGNAQNAQIALKGISYSNGLIINASSEAKFFKNFVYGVNLAIGKEYVLPKNYFIRAKLKMILTTPWSGLDRLGKSQGELFYETVTLTVGVGKKFANINLKKKKK